MGTILGGLIGHLFDRAVEERQSLEGYPPYSWAEPVSSAQLQFLSSLIGLSMAVAYADGEVKVSQVEALKSFFRENFPYAPDDQGLIQGMIEETFLHRQSLEVERLCLYYRSVSTYPGRLLLLRLLFKIAAADTRGVQDREEGLIRRISQLLGVEASSFQSIRAEFRREDGGAYRVLGVSPEASDAEIRSAYRQLAYQHHPDRVANLGEEFVKVAEEKFKFIKQAYEEIGRQRGWKT